jgi:uncharacterized protein
MHIEELGRQASLDFLAGRHLGRLACANNSQPYVTPCHFVYHDQWIYGFSTVGKKIEWLRANPLACIEVDEIASPQQWTSVVVFGRYEELGKTADGAAARELAHTLLQQHGLWWEPGYARTVLHGAARPLDPVYYRLSIDAISGHRAIPG